jgi:hypothetical protein
MKLQEHKLVKTWFLTDDDGTEYLIKYSKDCTMDTDNYFMVYNYNKEEYLNGDEKRKIMNKLHQIICDFEHKYYEYTECTGTWDPKDE